jgi:nicotinate phosphoribosyltransferase
LNTSGLLTDYYEINMMCGYHENGMADRTAVFDLFIRTTPFGGGYAINAGLEAAVHFLTNVSFSDEDVAYLRNTSDFSESFLDRLREFRFAGDVFAAPEGSLVFPQEPILRVTGTLFETQLVESALLNIINFQTLIATKAARTTFAAGENKVLEFGLRRAQGQDGAFSATRAAFIGGVEGTSNTYAASMLDIPAMGTMAHSWIMSFKNELEAFRAYASTFPKSCVLLVDTINTLKSGVPNAITVGHEMREKGEELMGIRLDSGDLAYLGRKAREMLDEAGLNSTKIVASGDLDEWLIEDLQRQGAVIDMWGVGTQLVVGGKEGALGGVYKLASIERDGTIIPTMKVSDNPYKETLPGIKQVWRLYNDKGEMEADIIALESEDIGQRYKDGFMGFHPRLEYQKKHFYPASVRCMLHKVIEDGKQILDLPSLHQIRAFAKEELDRLHPTSKRLLNPHFYKVSISEELLHLRQNLRNGISGLE